jgi:integrase
MAAEPHKWLADYLNRHLGELEGLGDSKRDLKAARSWFNALLEYFRARHLTTPKQQKNYLVDTRNEIRKRFGDSHPALSVVNFDEKTWFDINAATHARVEERNENTNTKPIEKPFEIAAGAEALLTKKESTWADLAVGLGVATGRRISELLGARTTFAQKTDYSVLFTGQLKQQREMLTFEIPTLCPAASVVEAWKRLRFMLGPVYLSPRRSNDKGGSVSKPQTGTSPIWCSRATEKWTFTCIFSGPSTPRSPSISIARST